MNPLKGLTRWLSIRSAAANGSSPNPGRPNLGVRIVDGKVIPHSGCELNVVDHCNLACSDCNHASPVSGKHRASPDQVYRDFSAMATVFKPSLVKFIGGEPLLHPNLIELIAAVKRSRICGHMLVVTNGVLLPRMGERFWQAVDSIEISVYPGIPFEADTRELCRKMAAAHGVRVETHRFDRFRRTFSIPGFQDEKLMQRCYRACKIAHHWGCHSVHEGRFYKCPQSIYIPRMLGWAADRRTVDGLEIKDSPTFLHDLYSFLTSPEPLQSCRHCLDSHGIMRPLTQVPRKEWLAQHAQPAEALLDLEQLRKNEDETALIRPDDIKTRTAIWPG